MSEWGLGSWGDDEFGAELLALARVQYVRTNRLRAAFNQPVLQRDPSGYFDALNQSNWTLIRIGGGFAPKVARVESTEDPRSVELVLLHDLEAGVAYDLVAAVQIRGGTP